MSMIVTKGLIKKTLVTGLVRKTLLATGNKLYQYNFDGIDDHAKPPPIPIEIGDVIKATAFKGTAPSTFEYVFDTDTLSSSGRVCFGISTSNTFFILNASSVLVNGNLVNHLEDASAYDNTLLNIELTASSNLYPLGVFGRGFTGDRYWSGVIKDIGVERLNPTLALPNLFYPIDDGPGATVIRQVLPTQDDWDATPFNFNNERWERV